MFCSGCGQPLSLGQAVCSQCGRPALPAVPPVPGLEFQVQTYAGKVKALSVVWFIYAAYSLITGIAHLALAKAFFSGQFGPWAHGPWSGGSPTPPFWFAPAILRFAWGFLALRVGLAIVAGWGLLERAQWGRIVAIVAAFVTIFSFSHFLFGTAIGIWTLVVLMGYRNTTLYDQL